MVELIDINSLLRNNPSETRRALEDLFYEDQELFEQICPQYFDVQTGLIQKAHYEGIILSRAISEYNQNGQPFSLVMFDLDKFHPFNEKYGHQVGDQAISEFVKVLKKNFRSHERRNKIPEGEYAKQRAGERREDFDGFDNFGLVARVGGGEEFSVLLKNCDEDGAYNAAQRAVESTRKIQIPYQDQVLSITASAGVAEYSFGMRAKDLITNVDKALYKAKNNGRNRVERFSRI